MSSYFRRQLAEYVEYHRDPCNCAMHVIGIVFLFLAAVLPLNCWHITVFGIQTSAATIAVVPVLIYWFLLDFALGVGILIAAVVLLSAAASFDRKPPESVGNVVANGRAHRCRRRIANRWTQGVRASAAGVGRQSHPFAARTNVRDG